MDCSVVREKWRRGVVLGSGLFAALLVAAVGLQAETPKRQKPTAAGKRPATIAARQPAISPEDREFFETKIRPLLADNCFTCHAAANKTAQGGLQLDSRARLLKGGSRGAAVVPGKPEASLLLRAVSHNDPKLQMPPNNRLPAERIAALTEWVKRGAPWPSDVTAAAASSGFSVKARSQHWAYQPLRKVAPPLTNDQRPTTNAPKLKTRNQKPETRNQNPIDAFLRVKREAKGLKPAPPADKRMLIRRITFDLIGLPPTPEEVAAFLNDNSPNAYEKVVERLLASPHYGERWARHWLDLVRYAETDGHEFDFEKPGAFEYRDYVIRALNADVGYNQFVQEHIAGDLLPNPRRHPVEKFNESVIGTGFWWLGEGKHSPVDLLVDEGERVDNQIDVFGKAFLGQTLACARCHDHKFDAISTKDYYALSGILKSSRYTLAAVNPAESVQPAVQRLSEFSRLLQRDLPRETAPQVGRWLGEVLSPNPPTPFPTSPRSSAGKGENSALHNALASPFPVSAANVVGKGVGGLGNLARGVWARAMMEAEKNPADPFHAWAMLTKEETSRSSEAFAAKRAELVKTLRERAEAAKKARESAVVFEGFGKTKYDGWYVNGEAFGAGPTTAAMRWSNVGQVVNVLGAGVADSGQASESLQGALRSKTFTLSKNFVLFRMAGNGGQARLIIDGFQRIMAPIYGGLTLGLKAPDRMAWYAMDVNKWVGHKAYIEFLDMGPGRTVVDEIVFADSPTLPEAPNPLILTMLADPALTSPEALAKRYLALCEETLSLWAGGKLNAAPDAIARRELVNWLMRNDPVRQAEEEPKRIPMSPTLLASWEQYRKYEAELPSLRRVLAAADGTGVDDRVHLRGSPKTLGETVPRRFLEVFSVTSSRPHPATPSPNSGREGVRRLALQSDCGRLELAQSLTTQAAPLLARVMVNRVWHHHFGAGLVRTPDDFGLMGERPTHPELLDYLAGEFIRQGWSLKQMHRMIVLSQAYRMASRSDAKTEEADPQNRLLHRMNVRRLESEAVRDTILAVSGKLDRTLYGPSVLPYLTEFMEGRGRPTSSGPLDGNGRRSLYIGVRRNFLTPFFQAFDYPTPFSTMGRRTVSNVPAQALALMNNPFVVEQTTVWAKRLLSQPGTAAERVNGMYDTAFGRPPTEAERADALAFVAQQEKEYGAADDPRAWADLCHVLFNLKEFIYVH
jgi:hypothetical protein